ncbi:MAG: TldD/PmbA family protein [Kiritimatiellia bacterium]
MKDRLFSALKHSTADYAEIRIEARDTLELVMRGGELEVVALASRQGGLVRACYRGGWGVVSFESLAHLAGRVREACHCARLVGRETTQLAEVAPVEAECHAELRRDFRGVAVDEKLKLIRLYHDIIRGAHPRVESAYAAYRESFRTVWFASTRGNYFMEERPYVACSLFAIARDGSLVQRASHSTASATTFDAVSGLEPIAQQVGERAAALLKAPKPEGGPTTVVLDQRMGGVFVHEAFGHLSEADHFHENPRLRELMRLGETVGARGLNIVDDGTYPGSIGSQCFDDEGTPTRKTWLVRDGVLCGHLHSLETAAKLGEAPTGNARAIGSDARPIVRMTNTYIENGTLCLRELFAGVERGIYACDSYGGETEMEMFTFAAAYGYRIENGQIGELLRDVTLTGNVFQTLKAIDGIANDLILFQTGGGCGKAGQSPLPVGHGSPHIRIRDVVVGGG